MLRNGKRTSTRSAQALVSCYSSVQLKNPTVRAILQRCANRRLKRIGQEGRKSAKLVKLESEFRNNPIFPNASAASPVQSGTDTSPIAVPEPKANAKRAVARDQVPLNAKQRREFKKGANQRMKQLQKQQKNKK